MRFADAVETLRAQGASAFLELGPDPVLCAMARECLDEEGHALPCVRALREGRPEPETLIGALAAAHAAGAKLDWEAFFDGTGAKALPLPTYPFQRKRFWLVAQRRLSRSRRDRPAPARAPAPRRRDRGPRERGDSPSPAASRSQTHPWLADHAVLGTVLLPGTAFLELALCAAAQVGAADGRGAHPAGALLLAESAVALRVSLSAPDRAGKREISIHSRPEAPEAQWTRNATGTLSAQVKAPPEPIAQWPPPGAQEIEPEDLCARLAEAGFEYGPAFQGLRAAWREGQTSTPRSRCPPRPRGRMALGSIRPCWMRRCT